MQALFKILLAFRYGLAYNWIMKQKAPVSVEAPTGAVIRTAEAARVLNSSIRLLVVNFNRRFHNELPGLQSEM
jgi:hypothetical protein